MPATYTLGEAFDYFRQQSNLGPATLETYAYATQHFYAFIENSPMAAPHALAAPDPAERALSLLGLSA